MKAVRNTVIVKLGYTEKVGSIFLPESTKQYNADFWGEVVSVGPEVSFKDELQTGDKVIFYRNEGKRIEWDNQKYLVLQERHILGKYED